MSEQNVLAVMAQKKNQGVHRAQPAGVCVEGTGEEMVLVLSLKVADLRAARPGKERDAVGFALIPVEFVLPEGSFLISSEWVSITAR
jgi:hypothetical protein